MSKMSLLREYLKNFKGYTGASLQRGVFNCVQMIDLARHGNLSGEDFSEIDLRMYSLSSKVCNGCNFSKSYISLTTFFPQGHHDREAEYVCFSLDGKNLFSAHTDCFIAWDFYTGKATRTVNGHFCNPQTKASISIGPIDGSYYVNGSISPNNKLTAACRERLNVEITDYETRKVIQVLKGHMSEVTNIAFSPDSKHIVSSSMDGEIRKWDVTSGDLIFCIKQENGWATGGKLIKYFCDVNYSPDGKSMIVTASMINDFSIHIRDAITGQLHHKLFGHAGFVNSARFSQDGNYIVSASDDKTVNIWDGDTYSLLHTLHGHSDAVLCANYSCDGRYIVSSSFDMSIRVWDCTTLNTIRIIERGYKQIDSYICFHPNGINMLSFSGRLKELMIWDVCKGRLVNKLIGHKKGVKFAEYSADGDRIVSTDWNGNLYIWESDSGKLINHINLDDNRISASYSPCGKYVLVSSWEFARVLSITSMEVTHSFPISRIHYTCYSPSGNFILTASSGGKMHIWRAINFELMTAIQCHVSGYNYEFTMFSPNDAYLMYTSHYGKITKIWDCATGELLHSFKDVAFGSFSPCSKKIVAKKNNEIVEIIICTGNENKIMVPPDNVWQEDAIYSPDGKYILSRSNSHILLWDIASGNFVGYVASGNFCGGSDNKMRSAMFSPDSRYIANASFNTDKTIQIFNTETLSLFHSLHLLPGIQIINSDFRDVFSDDITEYEHGVLKSNGAIL